MRILLKILLLPVKLVALVLAVILKFVAWLALMAANLSSYVIGPIAVFVLGCLIYSIFKASWLNVGLLTAIEALIFAVLFGAGFVIGAVQLVADGLKAFVFS